MMVFNEHPISEIVSPDTRQNCDEAYHKYLLYHLRKSDSSSSDAANLEVRSTQSKRLETSKTQFYILTLPCSGLALRRIFSIIPRNTCFLTNMARLFHSLDTLYKTTKVLYEKRKIPYQ